ncbi:RNA polymerase sigma-70 factor [Bacteroidia bacterium]|nr:RNA polymerase sigma-70 factor [Bacteroidia bacterium]
MKHLSDKDLIPLLRMGDMNGYEILFRRYYMRVLVFVRSVIGNDWYSEDIAQNVFMKLWQKRDIIYGNSINHLLFTIARNEIADYFRSAVHTSPLDSDLIFSENENTIEEQFYASEIDEIVTKAVEELSERRKEIYYLSRRDYLSNKEIAERLNISVRTVEKHLEFVLKHIRKYL